MNQEPLQSRAFRLVLVALTAAAFAGVGLSWFTTRRADNAVETALARWQASHAREIQLQQLDAAVAAADAAAETFLATWRSRGLDLAAEAEAAVRGRFDALRRALDDAPTLLALAREIDAQLDERQRNFAQLVEWTRAGQFNRVREWSESHREALRAAVLRRHIAQLQEAERTTRERERAGLDRAVRQSARASRISWIVVGGLCVLVLWLLWHYERARRLVVMCAWTRTVEYNGEWLSFEEYLKRRFGLHTSHGIRPDQAEKVLEADRESNPPQ